MSNDNPENNDTALQEGSNEQKTITEQELDGDSLTNNNNITFNSNQPTNADGGELTVGMFQQFQQLMSQFNNQIITMRSTQQEELQLAQQQLAEEREAIQADRQLLQDRIQYRFDIFFF